MADIRARYDEIFATCARTPGGFEHEPDRRGFHEVSREERIKLWDRLYDEPGFGIWLQNFREIFTDDDANAEISAYIADRIRRRVKDPKVAEKLIPKDHGFGVQRVPLETYYYEAFNRPNVHLVDLSETPLKRVTEKGLLIVSIAICGFANFSSVGMQIGGIGALAPERRADLAKLGLKALLCGTLASYLSATLAGIII